MAEGDDAKSRTRITDPQVMRALAHPARISILEHLSSTGEGVTATQMAGLVDLSPSATSYHLRELARYHLVEQAPGRGDGRERVWRSVSAGWNLDSDTDEPDVRAAGQELVDVYLSRDYARIKDYFARQHEEPAPWRAAATLMGKTLLLTVEELIEVNAAVNELLKPYERRRRVADPPAGARAVAVHYATFPTGKGLPPADMKE
jgi:DNA-binding transcriptional ArsR family regulator